MCPFNKYAIEKESLSMRMEKFPIPMVTTFRLMIMPAFG